MKIAKARYTGPMRTHQRRGPSGRRYMFNNPPLQDSPWVAIHTLEDARQLARNDDVFDIEWTVQGEVTRSIGDELADAADALKSLSYRQKQRLTTALGLDVSGNADEDRLDDELLPAVQDMADSMTLHTK